MGIFDPKAESQIRPMPVQQASPSPLAVGISGLLGVAGGFLDDMNRGGSKGDSEPPWDQLNGLLARAKTYRDEGREDLARKQEVQAWNFATAAGFPISSSGFSQNWSMHSGGASLEDAGLSPDERNKAMVRGHEDYNKYSSIALYKNPNASQEEIDAFVSQQIALDSQAQFSSESSERDFQLFGKADLQRRVQLDVEHLQSIAAQDADGTFSNEEAGAFGIQIKSVLDSLNAQRPAGVTDDEWNEVIGPLVTLQNATAAAEKWTSAEEVSKRQLATLYASLEGVKPAAQIPIIAALKSGDFQQLAIVLEQFMPEDAFDIQQSLKEEISIGLTKALGIDVKTPNGAPTVEGTNGQAQRTFGGSEPVPLDARGIPDSKTVFGTETFDNGKSAEENLSEARSLTKGIKSGNLTDTKMLANLSLAISKDVMEATSGPGHDGRYIDGVDAREIYDGSMTSAIDTVGTNDPKTAARMAAGHVLALDRQADIAVKQITEVIDSYPWVTPTRDKQGNVTGFDIDTGFVEQRAIEKYGAEIAGEVMGFLRTQDDLIGFFREPLDPLSDDIPVELRFYLNGLKDEVSLGDMPEQLGKQIEDVQFFRDRSAHFSRVYDNYAQSAGIYKYAKSAGISTTTLGASTPGVTGKAANVLGKYGFDSAKLEKENGLPEDYLNTIVMIESGGDAYAVSSTKAKGLFQFTSDTWKQYGSGDRFDPVANINGGVAFSRDNAKGLRETLGRQPAGWELYLAHQQGLGGARILLSADPEMNVVDALVAGGLSRERAIRNISVNNGDVNGSVGKFTKKWEDRYASASGIPVSEGSGERPAPETGAAVSEALGEGEAVSGAPEASPRPEARPEVGAAPETSPTPEARPTFQPTEEQRQGLRDMGIEDPQIDMMLRGLAEDEANEVINRLVEGRRSKVKVEKASRKDIDSLNMRQLSQIRRLGGDPEQALFLKDAGEVDQAIAQGLIEAGQVIVLESGEVMLAEED